MLRTSLRRCQCSYGTILVDEFLSSNAQDFIEEPHMTKWNRHPARFLSSNAQDFIEDVSGGVWSEW